MLRAGEVLRSLWPTRLLNCRHLGSRPTVVASDLELTKLEPRIASRLGDLQVATVYELRVPDYRMGA